MNQRQAKAQRRYTAYHEAAHAVIRHRVCRQRFDCITISSDVMADATGALVVEKPAVIYGMENAANDVIATLAGPIAEARHRKMSLLGIALTSGREDYRYAGDLIQRLKDKNYPDAIHLEAMAQDAVSQYWHQIVKIAGELELRLHLDHDDFLELLPDDPNETTV